MTDSNYNLYMQRLREYKARALKQAADSFPDHPNPEKVSCIAAVEILKEVLNGLDGAPLEAKEAMRDFMKEHE